MNAAAIETLAIQLGLCAAQRMSEQHVRIITDRYATIINIVFCDYRSDRARGYSASFLHMLLRLRWHLEWYQHCGATVTFQPRVREGNEEWSPHHLANAARTSSKPLFRLRGSLWCERLL